VKLLRPPLLGRTLLVGACIRQRVKLPRGWLPRCSMRATARITRRRERAEFVTSFGGEFDVGSLDRDLNGPQSAPARPRPDVRSMRLSPGGGDHQAAMPPLIRCLHGAEQAFPLICSRRRSIRSASVKLHKLESLVDSVKRQLVAKKVLITSNAWSRRSGHPPAAQVLSA